jgi:hemerythrin-like metal-binding protein
VKRLTWTEEIYGTGVPELDWQHQRLFAAVNALLEAIERGATQHDFATLLACLTEHVRCHFPCEEQVMEQRNCSACDANKAAHREFVADLAGLREQMEREGASADVVQKLQFWLITWIERHVTMIDTRLRETSAE